MGCHRKTRGRRRGVAAPVPPAVRPPAQVHAADLNTATSPRPQRQVVTRSSTPQHGVPDHHGQASCDDRFVTTVRYGDALRAADMAPDQARRHGRRGRSRVGDLRLLVPAGKPAGSFWVPCRTAVVRLPHGCGQSRVRRGGPAGLGSEEGGRARGISLRRCVGGVGEAPGLCQGDELLRERPDGADGVWVSGHPARPPRPAPDIQGS